MTTRLLLTTPAVAAALAGLAVAKPAAPAPAAGIEIRPLQVDEEISGELAAGDVVLPDETLADIYEVPVTAGQSYRAELRSPDFDAVLLHLNDEHVVVDVNDDEPGVGADTDSALTITPEGDTLFIGANTLSKDMSGSYTLVIHAVDNAAPSAPTPAPGGEESEDEVPATPIRAGSPVNGNIAASDATAPDGTHYDPYSLTVKAGEIYRVVMASDEFDTYLSVLNTDRTVLGSCDDFDGTNSQVLIEAPTDGDLRIIANGLGERDFGNYTLTIIQE